MIHLINSVPWQQKPIWALWQSFKVFQNQSRQNYFYLNFEFVIDMNQIYNIYCQQDSFASLWVNILPEAFPQGRKLSCWQWITHYFSCSGVTGYRIYIYLAGSKINDQLFRLSHLFHIRQQLLLESWHINPQAIQHCYRLGYCCLLHTYLLFIIDFLVFNLFYQNWGSAESVQQTISNACTPHTRTHLCFLSVYVCAQSMWFCLCLWCGLRHIYNNNERKGSDT